MRQKIFIPMFGSQTVDVIDRNDYLVMIRMVWACELVFVIIDRETYKKWRVKQ